jgi:hypothetical protein
MSTLQVGFAAFFPREERIETETGNGDRSVFMLVASRSATLMAATTRFLWLVVMAMVAATIVFLLLAASGGAGY